MKNLSIHAIYFIIDKRFNSKIQIFLDQLIQGVSMSL
jgi:hypothetical protein